MSTIAPPRLSKSTWLDAGLTALCADGPDSLRAEVLARRMGVTKGSFYWHFADVPAFHGALLARWSDAMQVQVQAVMNAHAADAARLRQLCQDIAGGADGGTWPAIRAWAQSNDLARAAVDDMDTALLQQIEGLLGNLDVGNPEMARIVYATATGLAGLGGSHAAQNAQAAGSLVDLVLALR